MSGAKRARTADLLGAIQALSQLSYSPGNQDFTTRSVDVDRGSDGRLLVRPVRGPHRLEHAAVARGIGGHGGEAVDREATVERHRPEEDRRAEPGRRRRRLPE